VPRLKKIWADAAYRGKELADWCQQQGGWELEIVERESGTKGFHVQPRRWVVERSFAWLSRNRRLARDYERKVQTSETLIEVAATRLLLRRLVRDRADELLPYDRRMSGACLVASARGQRVHSDLARAGDAQRSRAGCVYLRRMLSTSQDAHRLSMSPLDFRMAFGYTRR
jgi:transposase